MAGRDGCEIFRSTLRRISCLATLAFIHNILPKLNLWIIILIIIVIIVVIIIAWGWLWTRSVSGARGPAGPDRFAPYQTPDDALVLLSCPFSAKDPRLVLNNQQLKVYRTRFSYSSIPPLSIKANLWLANMRTWSHTNTPYLGSARRIKN